MGLDITAYSNLESIGRHTEDWCDDEDHITAFTYDDFPHAFRGLPVLGATVVSGSSLLLGGCYVETEKTESHDFQAGSYSGYNVWRSDLQAQFNPALDPDGPFYELIRFADNEGTIGPDAAADLLEDFGRHEANYLPPEGCLPDRYHHWARAFALAANGGLVRFH